MKYGWEIADEVQRFCTNTSEIQFVELEKVKKLIEALEFYANPENWEYTDSGGQFDWYTQIKEDVWRNPEVGEGGGIDYAGKRAREALKKFRGEK